MPGDDEILRIGLDNVQMSLKGFIWLEDRFTFGVFDE